MLRIVEAKLHEINIRTKRGLKIEVNRSWLRRIVSKVLATNGTTGPVELGFVITDSATVRRLNKTYRFKDEPTDVLAFQVGLHNNDEAKTHFVSPPDGVTHLGEVVISYPVAVQQAHEQGHSIEQELALLTVHGVLHLLGYNHEEVRERRRMRAKEKRLLGVLGYNRQ